MPQSQGQMQPMQDPRLKHLPAEGVVMAISELDLQMDPSPHPFLEHNQQAIAENWTQEIAAKPALFNGKMILMRDVAVKDGRLDAIGHLIDYAAFLYWRRQSQPQAGFHLFAYPVLVTKDNAILAVEMGAQTANAGQVYCPAGSLDASDIIGTHVDVEANMRREVLEETGLVLQDHEADGTLYLYRMDYRFILFRKYHLDLTVDQAFTHIRAHMLRDQEKEIAAPVAITSADPMAHRYNSSMQPLLNWFFK